MIGEILKNKREELGLDLKEVAHTLRIQFEYLKALENNTLGKLPPAVYTRGYIREYARFLSVDPEPLVDEYAGWMAPEEKVQPELSPAKKKLPLPRGIFLLPLVVALVAAVMIFFPKSKTPSGESRHLQQPVAVNPPKLPESHRDKVPPVAVVSPPQLPAIDRGKVSPAPARSESRYVLNIVATEATWLRIEMGDGKSEEVLMKAGETKNWTSQNGFDVKLGNAGGVRLALNGKDLGTPGEKGRVVKLRIPQDNPPQQPPG